MFALLDYQWPDWAKKKFTAKELMYVYVGESFRGFGLGSKIITMAKELTENQGAKMIIFDTLNPNLNKFYERQGAKIICDSELIVKNDNEVLRYPTTAFRM